MSVEAPLSDKRDYLPDFFFTAATVANPSKSMGDDALASKYHSPEFADSYSRRRAQQRAWFKTRGKERETVLDPEEYSSTERRRQEGYRKYFGKQIKPKGGDPRERLPVQLADTSLTLGGRYQTRAERIEQGNCLENFGLRAKAMRFILCARIGRRLDCPRDHPNNKFARHFMCGLRYCSVCGPKQFKKRFAERLRDLTPVVEKLLSEGRERGRKMVVAKLDFTIKKTLIMPTRADVRKFHADLRRFFRAMERQFQINRKDYGWDGCDELGGNNTNLHRHCVYVGPWLPQKHKELSALWTKIRGQYSIVSIKTAKNFPGALAHAMHYPAKFLTQSTPERLAALEATFHRTRRISSGGAFYNVDSQREPGESGGLTHCPHCQTPLQEILEGWVPVSVLEREGRLCIVEATRLSAASAAISGPAP